jgi:voltage-gated potassium channel
MLHDASTGKRWFEGLALAAILYSMVVYFMEFELTEAGRVRPGLDFWLWSERVLLVVFAGEYLFRWYHAKNRARYPFTPLAAIDLLAIVPSLVGVAVNFRSLKLLRTLPLLRLFKLYRYNKALQRVMHGFRIVKDELAVVGFVVVIVVLFSSMAIYEFEHDEQPKDFGTLADAMWWSFVTLTTVGYGDLYPVTAGGRIVAAFTMVVGIGIFGTFISLIGSSFISTMRDGNANDPSRMILGHPHLEREARRTAPWIDAHAERSEAG